jgi:hypothetical protein
MRGITCTGCGRPSDVLRHDDGDDPTIGATTRSPVVVHAASRNPADLKEEATP